MLSPQMASIDFYQIAEKTRCFNHSALDLYVAIHLSYACPETECSASVLVGCNNFSA